MEEKLEIEELKSVIEALTFASDEPLTIEKIMITLENGVTEDSIKEAISSLNQDYKNTNRSFEIVKIAGGYQFVTKRKYSECIKKLYKTKITVRLSRAALETLAIISYKQPIAKHEIENIRGVNVDGVIKTLLERNLITISGREEGPGRPLLYVTTKEFLRYFGLNEISDLPKPREINELLKEEEKNSDVFVESKPEEFGIKSALEEPDTTKENANNEGEKIENVVVENTMGNNMDLKKEIDPNEEVH
jgi:segregation and condensation protein B